MGLRESSRRPLIFLVLIAAFSEQCEAADAVTIEVGSGRQVTMLRSGVQWRWDKQWVRSNGRHISGYWDVTAARWRGDRYQGITGNVQHITAVGVTPVFRWQNDSRIGFYAEAGIGAHLLSDLYDNNGKQLSTRFQFGDHIGVGYVFRNQVDIGVRFQHFSNGSIKKPNDGVNFAVIRVSYPL